MKWLLVFILFSCSTQNDQAKKEISAATESEAKPVSPYTVQPCYCMKIYKPVCAGGKPYGNSCEAECHGHKKWTEGPCSPAQKK
jgi:hypothetical protein